MTGNIVGESFEEYVKDQIKVRQKIYGSGFNQNRTSEQINYLNSKLSWIKMASSVEILKTKEETLELYGKEIGKVIIPGGEDKLPSELNSDSYLGQELAKKAILFNGLSSFESDKKYQTRSGISTTNSIWNSDKAYGLGGLDFGIQPMPGITSFTTKSLSRGSIRSANVQLKAFNKTQFEIIEILYLRLGFTMLIEWGNNTFFNNKYEKENIPTTLIENYWFKNNEGVEHLEMLRQIENKRKIYNGNYDGFFGKVVNFSWSFNPDGSYDISIDLNSLGDVIESLTVNILVPNPNINIGDESDSNKNINSISNFLYNLRVFLKSEKIEDQLDRLKRNKRKEVNLKQRLQKLKKSVVLPLEEDIIEDFRSEVINFGAYADEQGYKSNKLNDSTSNGDYSHFIRFGAFLSFLRDYVLIHIKEGAGGFPILNIDNDPEINIMYAEKSQFSVDPRICVVKNTYLPYLREKSKDYIEGVFKPLDPWCSPDSGTSLVFGRPMNVYLNFEFILQTLENHLDVKGNLKLYKFLSGLCDGVNKSLGGVNKLEPIIDETRNTIVILDQSIVPGKNQLLENEEETPILDLFGYNTNGSSNFVKSFSFKTEITPDLASMITIGATANATIVGEDATAFSKWNEGLKDRYNPEVYYPNEPIIKQKEEEEKEANNSVLKQQRRASNRSRKNSKPDTDTLKERRIKAIDSIEEYLRKAFGEIFNKDSRLTINKVNSRYFALDDLFIKQGYSILKNHLNALSNKRKEEKNQPNPSIGFIPFNLSLQLEGISGIKIYNKLVIDSKYLPSNYPENLEFLVKQVNHELKDNSWTTTLETITIPLITQGIEGLEKKLPLETAFELPLFAEPVRGMSIRNDSEGFGTFGASRIRDGVSTPGAHKGIDLATPAFETDVFSPITGNIKITSTKKRPLQKAIIEGTGEYEGIKVELAYLLPFYLLNTSNPTKDYFKFTPINKGDYIGKSTDLSTGGYSEGVTDHIHFSVYLGRDYNRFIDPDPKSGVINYG